MSAQLAETAVYSLAGIDYAFGLDWSAAGPTAPVRRHAARLGATHLARRQAMHQVGLARIAPQRRSRSLFGWRAAAAAFADLPPPPAEPHSMIAAFAFVSGEVWVVACSQGRLLADGDRMFPDAAAARLHFQQLFSRVPRWGRLFAPGDWQVARAEEAGPLAFLSDSRIAGSSRSIRLLAALGVDVGPGVPLRRIAPGWALARRPATAAALFALSGAVISQVPVWRPAPPPPPLPPLLTPWYPVVPSLAIAVGNCLGAISAALERPTAPGWEVGEVSCNDSGLTVAMAARPYTPLSDLIRYHPDAQLQSASRTALLQGPPPPQAPAATIGPPLPTPEAMLAAFGVIDEKTRALNSFTPPQMPTDTAPLQMGVPRPRPYRQMSWTLQTQAPPSFWRTDLGAIAGVALTGLSLKRVDGGLTWTIRGVAYVAP